MSNESPVRIPQWLRERFPPDQRSAVDYLRGLIDEDMLREIAEADYSRDVEEHLAALMPIWEGGELTELDCCFPMYVLALTRWSEPANSERNPGSTDSRGHLIRAFSCAILLATPNVDFSENGSLIQMVDSVSILGREAQEATARFLVWQYEEMGCYEERPFFALALVAITQSLEETLTTSMEQDLADWVVDEESFQRSDLAEFSDSNRTAPWLFGLSHNDLRNNQWEALIRRMQERSGATPLGRMLSKYHQEQQTSSDQNGT